MEKERNLESVENNSTLIDNSTERSCACTCSYTYIHTCTGGGDGEREESRVCREQFDYD
jgi:hypothetical protein